VNSRVGIGDTTPIGRVSMVVINGHWMMGQDKWSPSTRATHTGEDHSLFLLSKPDQCHDRTETPALQIS